MPMLTTYGVDCPDCLKIDGVAREVGFDPETGIACEKGHRFDAIPEKGKKATVPRLADVEPSRTVTPEAHSSAPGASVSVTEEPVKYGTEAAHDAVNRVVGRQTVCRVEAGEMVRLSGRDLLFGLRIPETLADTLQAYAEEQARTAGPVAIEKLRELLESRLLNILQQEWFR